MRAALGTLLAKGLSQIAPEVRCRIRSHQERKVYLTFDDGPSASGTSDILDVLARYNVPATFFVVGENAARHPQAVRDMKAAGHAVGNHSFSHVDAWKTSPGLLEHDLSRATDTLETLLGTSPRWMRPPYGRLTPTMINWSRRHQQQILLWDVMPPDFESGVSPGQVVRKMTRGVRPGSVICLHDNRASRRVTPAALRFAIPRMIDAGWQFATVD